MTVPLLGRGGYARSLLATFGQDVILENGDVIQGIVREWFGDQYAPMQGGYPEVVRHLWVPRASGFDPQRVLIGTDLYRAAQPLDRLDHWRRYDMIPVDPVFQDAQLVVSAGVPTVSITAEAVP